MFEGGLQSEEDVEAEDGCQHNPCVFNPAHEEFNRHFSGEEV